MDAIMEILQPIIDTIAGLFEGGIDFDSIIAMIQEAIGSIMG